MRARKAIIRPTVVTAKLTISMKWGPLMSSDPALAVSAYLNKHTKLSNRYRMVFIDFPAVLNYIYAIDSVLSDFEGNTYKISIEQVQ